MKQKALIPMISINTIEQKIFLVRGERIILDSDLAELYGVKTKALVQALKRNAERFPRDFMFQLSTKEYVNLRSQFVTSSSEHGGRRYLPYVFTEHGALMAANILKSDRAIQVSIQVIRTFILMRQALATNRDLTRKLNDLEKKYDKQFAIVFKAIRALMNPPKPKYIKPRKIGFRVN